MDKEQQERRNAAGQETKKDGEPSLKGTFVSVMLLGAVVLVSWAAVFILFLSRQ